MLATIEGNVTQILEDSLVINVSGIGFQVFVPAYLSRSAELHKSMALFTHLIVREDALTLYGFSTQEEKEMFGLLLGTNGVGPRTALMVLSTLSLDLIKDSVIQENSEIFNRVPGIGKKTAQSIVLQLQGKISKKGQLPGGYIAKIDDDVVSALTSLGYSIVEAQTALQMIEKDAPDDLETRLRQALRYFV